MFGEFGVPLAQKKESTQKGGITVNLKKWSQKVIDGVEKMIDSGRVQPKSYHDLRHCADLLQEGPQPFLWDTEIYTKKRQRGVIQTVQMEDDLADVQDMPDQSDDETPQHILRETYLYRSDIEPFWGFARLLTLFVPCTLISQTDCAF